jgi:hypothetical protein
MEFQIIIGYAIGLAALVYVIRISAKQFKNSEFDPQCDDCPVPDIMDKKEKSD